MTSEILRHLRLYIAGELSRREFEDWFVPAAWNLRAEDDPSGSALSEQVYLALAEADNGHLDEAELLERFAELDAASSPAVRTRRFR